MAVPLQSDVPTFVAPAHTRLDYVPGRLVVAVHESVDEPFEYLQREAGAHTLESVDTGVTIVGLDERALSPELLRTVESSRAVAFAERMPARWLSVAPGAPDPRHNRQWGLRAIRWFDADVSDCDRVTVAVCDTGVDRDHPDLKGAIASYDHEGTSATDVIGHGTHVSGIAAARADDTAGVAGVAPCRIAMWKVFPDEPLQGSFYVDGTRFLRVLGAVAGSGAKVLNLSLGGTQSSRAEQLLFDRLEQAGVTVVAAMGNEFQHGNPVEYPAAYDHVLAVGACSETNRRSAFSNTGRHIGLAAPGSNILSTLPTKPSDYRPDTDYASWSGTSMATPQVAAAVALVSATHSEWTPADVKKHLRDRAAKVAELRGKDFSEEYGSGVLDIAALLAAD